MRKKSQSCASGSAVAGQLMDTSIQPLSTAGSPCTSKLTYSLAPTGGTPAGLVRVIPVCGGARASRPDRPITSGRVEGLTSKSNRPPVDVYSVVRVSV